MKFKGYIAELTKFTIATSLVLGLAFAILLLVTGGAEGIITLDIDFSASDSIWFLLGTPLLLTAVFLLLSPLSYCLYLVAFTKKPVS